MHTDEKPKGMVLPELETAKVMVRKVMIDENGRIYEVEEEIDVPVFPKEMEKP